jgi:Tol biopolymer transport system component
VTLRREATIQRWAAAFAVIALVVVAGVVVSTAWAAPATTVRVSLKSNGTEVNTDNEYPSVSGNGQFVAFESAGKFTANDDGVDEDVFVRNRSTKKTTRVSVKANGKEIPGANSAQSSISANGRYVAFASDGAFVAGDTNGRADIYVKDRDTGKVTRASLGKTGNQVSADAINPAISANGRYVGFLSDGAFDPTDSNGMNDVYVRDLTNRTTRRASVRNNGTETEGDAGNPSISANGRYVAFYSNDQQMTADTDYGFLVDYDVFVRDMTQNNTIRASLKSDGAEADPAGNQDNQTPVISADGRFVAFSADSYGAFVPTDANNQPDVYVHNLQNGKTTRVSVKSNGQEAAGSSGTGSERPLAISADGTRVAFEAYAALVGTDTNNERDVYLRDRTANTTRRVSVKSNGDQVTSGAGGQQLPAISGDGNWAAFQTVAHVTPGDAGMDFDAFLRGPLG